MAVQHHPTVAGTTRAAPAPAPSGHTLSTAGLKTLAALRIVTGAIFVWAFLDKLFGLSYSTPTERSWLEGASPASGYLSHVSVGPMESTYHGWAGNTLIDLLYMGGLLGVGLALVAGIGLRVTAVAGPLMMLFLWLGEFPPAQHLSDGTPSMSTNPLIDQHVVYATVMVVVGVCSAGRVWGLGGAWARLPVVQRYPWLR
ncbi:DoxX family membrane protein [Streptomyces sp. RFCAC02]|uniref:DoxX family membrane protein n=1 Tax=Streptomyces sp. RFCAC02 TaxID=2499143 RepID=UPI00101EBE5E|nr:DoxX family membrane protein [Streptomyces sp. RFCAC02]